MLKEQIKRKQHILKRLVQIAIEKHGKTILWKPIPIVGLNEWYLSELGDLIRFKGKAGKGYAIKLRVQITMKEGRRIQNGLAKDQFYKDGKRFYLASRNRLMMLTFGNWTMDDYNNSKLKLFPKNGNVLDVRIENLKPEYNHTKGIMESYGLKNRSKLSNLEKLKIRRSSKPKAQLAREFNISYRQVRTIKTGINI